MIGILILAALIVIVLSGAKRLPELMGALWNSGHIHFKQLLAGQFPSK